MDFWRHFRVLSPIQQAHSSQLSKDPVFTDKFSAITLLPGYKTALPEVSKNQPPLHKMLALLVAVPAPHRICLPSVL